MRKALFGVALALWLSPAGHAATPTRILYASDWTGPTELFAIRPAGGAPLGQVTRGFESPCIQEFFACGFADALTSPDGRWVLYRNAVLPAAIQAQAQSLWIGHPDGTGLRLLVRAGADFVGPAAWAPTSRRFAYVTSAGVWIAQPDGSGARTAHADIPRALSWSPDGRALAMLSYPQGPSNGSARLTILRGNRTKLLAEVVGVSVDWSPNGRWLAVSGNDPADPVTLISATNGRQRRVIGRGKNVKWSPRGRYFASTTPAGLLLTDTQAGRMRLLTKDTAYQPPYNAEPAGFAWAPDGHALAYLTTGIRNDYIVQGDLKVVTLYGQVRTVVAGKSAYGGRILSVAWTREPRGARYTKSNVTPKGLLADGPVLQLAADGPAVGFATTCNRVSVWKPSTDSLFTTAQVPLVGVGPYCDWGDRWDLYTLALAGQRVVYGFNAGGLSSFWSLRQLTTSQPDGTQLDGATGSLGGPWQHALGTAVGSGSLIVYSFWNEANIQPGLPFRVTSQTVMRAEPGGCPCKTLASSPGPLVPYDVAGDRVVVSGDRETIVLDPEGERLVSLPISALGAQLDGDHLVVLVPGELRDYSIRSGQLLHTSMLPDVESGSECGSPHYCDRHRPRLLLEDVRTGLVTYVLDGEVHLRRVFDGADMVIAPGSLARFFDGGLVYAYGARISVVPFDQLPLRGS